MSGLRIFSDYHHAGCARGLALLLQDRLGHGFYLPDAEFIRAVIDQGMPEGVMMPAVPSWLIKMGGYPELKLGADKEWKNLVNYEEFMDTKWDAFLCTRIETQPFFKKALEHHTDTKVIAMTGNDGVIFEYDWIKNLMATDEPTFHRAPGDINKIFYSQEIGRQYGQTFSPVANHKKVNCFINCWPTFVDDWTWNYHSGAWGGTCPQCGHPPSKYAPVIKPYHIWEGAKAMVPDVVFSDYGIHCSMGCLPEVCLPVEYADSAATVHMKTYDGYGFSMLQSIACGRPVIVPRGFHRYRTANKYLIPDLTCFEAEWNPESLAERVRYITDNITRANAYAEACYKAAQGLFQWDHEAYRMKEFLGELI